MATPTQAEFEQVLTHLMSADNALRNKAEAMYEEIKKTNPSWLVQALLHLLGVSPDPGLRQMCSVILRRVLSTGGAEEVFPRLPADIQTMVKQQLLALIARETSGPVGRGLAFCVSSLGTTLTEKGEWPELFPFLFAGVKDGDAALKKASLNIFSSLTSALADTQLEPYLPVLRDAFQFALSESQTLEVRIAAVEAATALVSSVSESNESVDLFQVLTSGVLSALAQALNQNANEQASDALEALITVAEDAPRLLQRNLPEVFAAMLQIAGSEQVEDSVRQLAVEFCLSYAENATRQTKKVPQFLETLFPMAMRWVSTVEEEPDWGVTEESEEDELSFYEVGLEVLDRLALALGGKFIEPVATGCIAKYLSDQSWKLRQAGLMAMTQIAEGCAKQLEKNLGSVLAMVLKHFTDPHERVRYAAARCILQLCTDFAPTLQIKFHSMVLPAVLAMLGGETVPRVCACVCLSVVNFMEGAQPGDVQPYLDELVTKLLLVLQNSRHRFLTEDAIAAFAGIAENCEGQFCKYYDTIVPFLKQVLLAPNYTKQDRMMRCKAIECISLIGMSVGKEKFGNDVREVMQVLHMTTQSPMESDDPQAQYILQAWSRIASVLKEEFAPYLPHLVPQLLAQASVQTDVTITEIPEGEEDAEDDDSEDGVETLRLSIQGVGDRKVQIKTSLIQDKALAVSVLEAFMEDVPKGMAPFVEAVSNVVVPLVKFAYSGDIRDSAAQCLHRMQAIAPEPQKREVLKHFVEVLIEAIFHESEVAVATSQVNSFHQCVLAAPPDSLSDEMVSKCADMCKKVFDESLRRRKDVRMQQSEVKDDEDEVDKLEAENEGEEELLVEAVEAVGVLLKTHRAFIPLFMGTFYPMWVDLLDERKGYGAVEHRLALCAFDDFVEHGYLLSPETVAPYIQPIVGYLLKFSAAEDADVVQASVFGLGICAQYGGAAFAQLVPQVVERLVVVSQSSRANDPFFEGATANAVASLVRVLRHHSGSVDVAALIGVVLSKLPLKGDDTEACMVHEQVMDWALAGHPAVLGPNRSNLPALKQLSSRLLELPDLINEPTKSKCTALLAVV
eukprot:RCo036847